MTNDSNYARGKLHHSSWHSNIHTPTQLNMWRTSIQYISYLNVKGLEESSLYSNPACIHKSLWIALSSLCICKFLTNGPLSIIMQLTLSYAWMTVFRLSVPSSTCLLHCCSRYNCMYSVTNSSGLHSFGSGWNRNWNPSRGYELQREPNQVTWAGLLLGPYWKLVVSGCAEPGPQFHFAVPTILAAIKFSCSYCIMTWSMSTRCSFRSSFSTWSPFCTLINICWVGMK